MLGGALAEINALSNCGKRVELVEEGRGRRWMVETVRVDRSFERSHSVDPYLPKPSIILVNKVTTSSNTDK